MFKFVNMTLKCLIPKSLCSLLLVSSFALVMPSAHARDEVSIFVVHELETQIIDAAQTFSESLDFPAPFLRTVSSEEAFNEFCSGVGTETPDVVVSTQRITPLQRSQCERSGVSNIGENIRLSDDGPAFIYLKVAHVSVILGLAELFDSLADDIDQSFSPGGRGRERLMLDTGDTRISESRSPKGQSIYTIEIGMESVIGDLIYSVSSIELRDNCGENIFIKSIQPTVNKGLYVVDGTILYERWTCIRTKLPEFKGLKTTWRTDTIKQKVLQQSYRLCNGSAYTVTIDGNELFIRSDHFETCREALSRSHVTPGNVERIYSIISQRLDDYMFRQVSDVNGLFANEFGSVFEASGLSKVLTAEFRHNRDASDVFVIVVEAVRP